MAEPAIQFYREDDILYLLMNRPPGNVTDKLFFSELADVIKKIEKDKKARGLIISSSGNHFSSGANLDELRAEILKKTGSPEKECEARSVQLFQYFADRPYPVIAAIKGCCLGSGLELALCCDYRIGTRNAVFSLPESSFGLMPGCGGTVRLPELIGQGPATEMILTGKRLLGDEALRLGLIDRIVPRKKLIEQAKTIVISHAPPI